MVCSGSGAAGALLDLAAKGAPNAYLDQAPEVTLFRQSYKRPTAFAIAEQCVGFQGAIAYGKFLTAVIPRNGDLIGETYFNAQLGALEINEAGAAGLTQANDYVLWVNSVGNVLVQRATLDIGGSRFDELHWFYLELWSRIAGKAGKYLGEMVGHFDNTEDQRDFAARDHSLYVPLFFAYTMAHGLNLPMIALQHHDVKIGIELADKVDLIKAYDSATPDTLEDIVANTTGGDLLDASLLINYVYLDTMERRLMAQQPHEFLFTQLQVQAGESIVAGTSQKTVSVQFNQPMIELFWFFQEDKQKQVSHLNWFSWGIDDPLGAYPWAAGVIARVDAIDTVEIKVNGHDRVAEREAQYFRLVQPYERHSSIPTIFVYNYCFALFPEESERPTGSCNASRIDNITFIFTFAKDVHGVSAIGYDGTLTIMTRSYNVMKVAGGMAAVRYA
jgi:hypothetical protein